MTNYVGVFRLTRDAVIPYAAPKPSGWAGKWKGKWVNSLGYGGDTGFVLKGTADGKLLAVWDDDTVTVVKMNNGLAYWEDHEEKNKMKKTETRLDGDILRLTYTATYPPKSKMTNYTGVWWLRGTPGTTRRPLFSQLSIPRFLPTQAQAENSKRDS